jgi:hypothetical protein
MQKLFYGFFFCYPNLLPPLLFKSIFLNLSPHLALFLAIVCGAWAWCSGIVSASGREDRGVEYLPECTDLKFNDTTQRTKIIQFFGHF